MQQYCIHIFCFISFFSINQFTNVKLTLGSAFQSHWTESFNMVLVFVAVQESFIHQVCTTWGNNHWKTFDGHFYQLSSTCGHIAAMQCKTSYSNFNIQIFRKNVNGLPSISRIRLMLDGTLVDLSPNSLAVNNQT